ncbi:MAG: NAD(P)-dependent oxidoreductase [Candidatus Marinimicrobia bacterium]|nr:NAD(P)-dependent oxidoreductase [Candidatus Neomarinimicrobiota bacterium]
MSTEGPVAVIGLGIIGSVWTRNWHADGLAVRAWNRTPKPDVPGWRPDLAQAVRGAAVVSLVLSDGPVTAGILDRILPALDRETIVVQSATIGVDETLSLAAQVQAAGHLYLDMPFTGSKPAAEQRQTVFFVGDDADVFSRVRPLYERLSRACLPIGRIGSAAAIKLAMNLNIAAVYQGLAESLALARAAGVPDETYWQVLDQNVGHSGLADLKRPKISQADWTPQFSIKHLHKDLSLALRLAATRDCVLPQTERLTASYQQQMEAGDADLDFAAMLRLVDRGRD